MQQTPSNPSSRARRKACHERTRRGRRGLGEGTSGTHAAPELLRVIPMSSFGPSVAEPDVECHHVDVVSREQITRMSLMLSVTTLIPATACS